VLGDDRVDMMLWDTGIQLYANVYYTTDDMLANHEADLVAYLKGSARGWGYAREHPEEAVDHLVAEYQNLDKASELEAVGPVLDFSFGDTTMKSGWGAMNAANWEAQIKSYADLKQFQGATPGVGDVMTTAILDASADIRMKVG